MVTVCGGAATTRSPRPRLEMLATQCPRLRRLSGRAAAYKLPFSLGPRPDFPRPSYPRGDAPPAWGCRPPIRLAPTAGSARKPWRGFSYPRRLQGRRASLTPLPPLRRTLTPLLSRPPRHPSRAHHSTSSAPPHVLRATARPPRHPRPSRSLHGATVVIVGRWGRRFSVAGVSVGRWGHPATRSALNDAGARLCSSQSCQWVTCCWLRRLRGCLRPFRLAVRLCCPPLGIRHELATMYVRR